MLLIRLDIGGHGNLRTPVLVLLILRPSILLVLNIRGIPLWLQKGWSLLLLPPPWPQGRPGSWLAEGREQSGSCPGLEERRVEGGQSLQGIRSLASVSLMVWPPTPPWASSVLSFILFLIIVEKVIFLHHIIKDGLNICLQEPSLPQLLQRLLLLLAEGLSGHQAHQQTYHHQDYLEWWKT